MSETTSHIANIAAKCIKYILCAVIIVILTIPVILYLPPAQRLIFNKGLEIASKSTGWDISVKAIDLSFPLKLTVNSALVVDRGDTIISAGRFYTSVKVLPLLAKSISLDSAVLDNAYYRMGGRDSAMYLTANLDRCRIIGGKVRLSKNHIVLDDGTISGGNINLYMNPDVTTPEKEDTTATTPWAITLGGIALHDVSYSMQMLPTIDSLYAYIGNATLKNGEINTGDATVDVGYLGLDSIFAKYLTPTKEYIDEHPTAEVSEEKTNNSDSLLWTIRGKQIELTNGNAIYATSGAIPKPGLDMEYIQVSDISIGIEDFYNRGMEISVPITELKGTERCGLAITGCKGIFAMDSTTMSAKDFKLATAHSALSLNAALQSSLFEQSPNAMINCTASASISPTDIADAFPDYSKYLRTIGYDNNINAIADVAGTLASLDIKDITLSIPHAVTVGANGYIRNILASNRQGHIDITGYSGNLNRFKSLFLDKATAASIGLPPINLHGGVGINGNTYSTAMNLKSSGGNAVLRGEVNLSSEKYDVTLNARDLPLEKFLPESLFKQLSATISASGKGFNPLVNGADANAEINIERFVYDNLDLDSIIATAVIKEGRGTLDIISTNAPLNLEAHAQSTLPNNHYDYSLSLNALNIDLQALHISTDPFNFRGVLDAQGILDTDSSAYTTAASITGLHLEQGDKAISSGKISLALNADTTHSNLTIAERDLMINANAHCSIDTLLARISALGPIIASQMEARYLNFDTIQKFIPPLEIHGSLGTRNIVNDYLRQSEMSVANADIVLVNDTSIRVLSKIEKLKFSGFTLDTITFGGKQRNVDLLYYLHIANAPGNLDQFAFTDITGKAGGNEADILLHQKNREGKTGFDFGVAGTVDNNEIRVTLTPENPIIGYRTWALNPDNFIEYDPLSGHIDANLDLRSDAGFINMHTDHVTDSVQEDIILRAGGINLAEWLNVSPFMPKIGGFLNANANISRDGNVFSGNGALGLSNLSYNKKDLGTIDLNVSLGEDPETGDNTATANISIDGRTAISAQGVIGNRADTTDTESMNYKLVIDRFPLTIANPFIPQNMAELSGYLSGLATLTGTRENPDINGNLHCDSTAIKLPMFGSRLTFGNEPVTVEHSNVVFHNFGIYGTNGNPITVTGNVLLQPLYNPYINLQLAGQNVQIVDSKYKSGSEVFGKAFIDLNGKAAGHMSQLAVRAFLNILSSTNATYVMQEDVNSIAQSKSDDVVKFVNFSDTTAVESDEKTDDSFNMNLNAVLNIQEGAQLSVNLSPDGKNKVQLGGAGTLTYDMEGSSEGRLSGRYTINSGFVRYYPPLISEKYFTFTPGSYVAFSGNMMNPTLSIYATGNQACTVLSDGSNPTRVNFEITAAVTNTLENMNVSFDLAAPNNSMIETELQSMTAAQRSAQAINLMLYGTYSSGQTSTATATNANMLYSLLGSQLNNLASKIVKGVDISFGINQYNTNNDGAPGTGMNYSYSVSKTLFDDRFKMTVGGNYDTGGESSDISVAQNLFSNISFEYKLNQSGTMSLQLYNKVTDNNIYQTQVNETGIAFTIRKKLSSLKNFFRNVKSRITRNSAPAQETQNKDEHSHEK